MRAEWMEKTAAVFLGLSLFAASSGAAYAYLTDHPDTLKNVVTTGSIGLKLTEPLWEKEKARNLTPRSVVQKNPTVKNTGKSEAWIFLRLEIPMKKIRLVDAATQKKTAAKKTELLTFEAAAEWEQIEKTESEDAMKYVYGYRQLTEPGEETVPLFEQVTLVNYLEGELTDEYFTLPIHAVAVQDGLCAEGAGLKEIYEAYCEQA